MEISEYYSGLSFDAHRFFGAHPQGAGQGVRFATWAPAAKRVEVLGDWNAWQGEELQPNWQGMGGAVWAGLCLLAQPGQLYKYRITGPDGTAAEHCDPYGFGMELRPGSASTVRGLPAYPFADAAWMAARGKGFDAPLSIYEVHAGSWRRESGGGFLSYAELAEQLPRYARENGYTHIEFMPLAEHPFDGSWGYQQTGLYAPTSRYGDPAGLCALVDACHRAGIGVILDFVPVHFAVDAYALRLYDGTALYEYPSAEVGESEWGSCNFIHSRGDVRSFLQSCAAYWLDCFHADGLRMDAVSRLLYWQGDPARGVNKDAVAFLKTMNAGLQQRFPTALLIAEDSTDYPKVTAPVEYGGLGFDYKWDLGWMNDTLDYFKKTPAERAAQFGRLSFSMVYAYREHYILPFSHDENVHGKATIAQKMCGGYGEKFPQARALYLYMAVHPGKKLDFMGNEFAQLREWSESREQDWLLLGYPLHDGFRAFRAELGALYRQYGAFWNGEYDPANFLWLDCDADARAACAVLRRGRGGEPALVALFNFSDRPLSRYAPALPGPGQRTLLLNTDWCCYGGSTPRPRAVRARRAEPFCARLAPYSGQLYLYRQQNAGAPQMPEQPK